ncbi:MAG: putative transposase [Candidatus Cloacimonadota bacterium]|nr:putative transposase [Candidatus Cloacimonadota bacterium]
MDRIDEVYNQIDRQNYDRNYRRVLALIHSGATLKFTGDAAKIVKKLQSEQIREKSDLSPLSELNEEVPDIDLRPQAKELLSCKTEAQLNAQFCEMVLERLKDCTAKVQEWRQITDEYNKGQFTPELFKIKGQRKERCLRLWVEKYLQNERDMFALIHKSKNQTKGRKVTYLEQQFLLKLLLTPQKVKIGTAISTVKDYERMGCLESPSSAPTLKRWVMDWKRDNMAIWTQARLGSKAVAETIVKTIIRDSSLLNVGDVWVADGHTLAFDIMNPKTGKAQRMTMIMVFDWASRYPVGASLAFTEDSQHIQIAFRNAFLNWGGVPKYVYLDNGKAFRAKLFNEKWQEHDLASDLAGIFPRLGIQVAFAESYNAKAKVIERFFKTFQERFERFIGSFRGASIDDKPATLMRNEKWARKMYDSTPPTIEEAMQMIGFFIRKMYGEAPHSGLHGKTPWEVYSAKPVPEEQKIEASKLNFMMLSTVRKTLRNNGIMLNKLMYWNTELIGHIGKELLIRYDLSDLRWILVYDMQDNFICQAEVRRSQDPFILLDKDNPISAAELHKEQKANKRHQKLIAKRTKQIVRETQEAVDRLVKPLPMAEVECNPIFVQAPTIKTPPPNAEQLMEELDKQIQATLPNKLDPPPALRLEEDDDEIKPKEKSFEEMLKFIGIK